MMKEFDAAVIGGGPGGYVAAIRAASKGYSVALIEERELGGTCLNRGCIPTKALLAGAELYHRMKSSKEFGIEAKELSFDLSKLWARSSAVVEKVRKGLEGLIAANKITVIQGRAKFEDPAILKICGKDAQKIKASKTIIATGSEPREIAAFPFDGEFIHDSTSLLQMKKFPKSIAIVGGGVIGCEFASMFADFGIKVHIIEMLPQILSTEGKLAAKAIEGVFKEKGVSIHCNVQVSQIRRTKNGVSVELSGGESIEAESSLVSVGRVYNSTDMGLEQLALDCHPNGSIAVDEYLETSVKGIFAIGDVTGKSLLAHVASHQGLIAADNLFGTERKKMHYHCIPSVVYSNPEVATVGLLEEKAREKGLDCASATFPLNILGKSQASSHTEGYVHIVYDRGNKLILGAQVVGHEASNLISEMTLAIQHELTLNCIIDTVHAHPTMGEAWLEIALMGNEEPLHFPPTKKKKRELAHA